MQHLVLMVSSGLGAIAVSLGAFGAHFLKDRLTPESLAVFETGVRYNFVHALALLGVGILMFHTTAKPLTISAILFAVGTVMFSGSLYLISSKTLLGIQGWTWLGPITPLGGLSLIGGWIAVGIGVVSLK